MKKNRVECSECKNFFIVPKFKSEVNFLSKVVQSHKCKLGKRVMFRMPKIASSYMAQDWGGWFRYCNDFKSKQDESTKM